MLYARRHRGDVEPDFIDSSNAALAGWPKLIYELIQDLATPGSLTKQIHALDITKEYDLMYRVFLLQDCCGCLPIYPNTVPCHDCGRLILGTLLVQHQDQEGHAQGYLSIAPASSTPQRAEVRGCAACESSWTGAAGSTRSCAQWRRTCTPFTRRKTWMCFSSGPAMMCTARTVTFRPGWTGRKPRTGRRNRRSSSSPAFGVPFPSRPIPWSSRSPCSWARRTASSTARRGV